MHGGPGRGEGWPSLPSRGAWIEMTPTTKTGCIWCVAPLAGSVDRNLNVWLSKTAYVVAPLAGSVDRNLHFSRPDKGPLVAPLAGSVDRNTAFALPASGLGESLPSRGAWIEISARRSFSSRTHCRSPRGERG